jgi:hypothetical protein
MAHSIRGLFLWGRNLPFYDKKISSAKTQFHYYRISFSARHSSSYGTVIEIGFRIVTSCGKYFAYVHEGFFLWKDLGLSNTNRHTDGCF